MIKQLVTTARNGSISVGVALSTSSMAFAEVEAQGLTLMLRSAL